MIHYYRYLLVKKKVFNYSELHFTEGTFYKIHTLIIYNKAEITYFGTSVSRFQAENFVIPGVDMMPLYLAWLGLASGNPIPALLPRRAPAPVEGVAKFLISLG